MADGGTQKKGPDGSGAGNKRQKRAVRTGSGKRTLRANNAKLIKRGGKHLSASEERERWGEQSLRSSHPSVRQKGNTRKKNQIYAKLNQEGGGRGSSVISKPKGERKKMLKENCGVPRRKGKGARQRKEKTKLERAPN